MGISCGYEPINITGRVVDETGIPLSSVDVQVCYSGWGFSSGRLVWDKEYCSETARTDQAGEYAVKFEGPVSSTLRAWKEGWIQTQDYNTTGSRIVLTRMEDYTFRLRAETEKQRSVNHRPLTDESKTEYYCSAILPEVRPVILNYHDETLSVTPVILENSLQRGEMIFSLQGPVRAVYSFCNEAVVKINNKVSDSTINFKAPVDSCGKDIHIIGINIPELCSIPDARVEILIPSISAMFDLKIWNR